MSERFCLTWNQVKNLLNTLLEAISGNEHLLIDAYIAASGVTTKDHSIEEIKNQLHVAVMGRGIPWLLYDIISSLITRLPQPSRKPLLKSISIKTQNGIEEVLQLASDGRWQIVWRYEGSSNLDEDNKFALDWYIPPNHEKAPLVPVAIIDYIAGCLSLLKSGLLLPASALLSIALEAALWDELEYRNVSRSTERITYSPCDWQFKRISNKLIVTIEGSALLLKEMDSITGGYRSEGKFVVRKSHKDNDKVYIKAEVDAKLAGFLISEHEEFKEIVTEKGLSEALQRSRKANILSTVAREVDDTMIKLRNNLIHLPAQGHLDLPVPNPAGGEFVSLDDIQRDPRLIPELIYLGVELINKIYTDR